MALQSACRQSRTDMLEKARALQAEAEAARTEAETESEACAGAVTTTVVELRKAYVKGSTETTLEEVRANLAQVPQTAVLQGDTASVVVILFIASGAQWTGTE